MKFSENWLRTWVDPDLSSEALAHTLTMAGLEVEALEMTLDNKVSPLKLTPNRSDCCGLAGIAREVAALTGCALKSIDIQIQPVTLTGQLPVKVDDAIGCPLYCGRLGGR